MPKGLFGRKSEDVETGQDEEQEETGNEQDESVEAEEIGAKFPGVDSPETAGVSLAQRAQRAFKLGSELSEEAKRNSDSDGGVAEEVSGSEDESCAPESVLAGDDEGTREVEDEADSEETDPEVLLAEARQEAEENFEKYLRAAAELENFKKRVARERADLIRYAGEHLARDLLDVADDLDRATSQELPGNAEEVLAGIRMIGERFISILEKHSIKGEEAVGEQFDPSKHEALLSVPKSDVEPGLVIEQLKKAYMFKDKLLRAAQVVVAVEPKESSEEEEDELGADPEEETADETEDLTQE